MKIKNEPKFTGKSVTGKSFTIPGYYYIQDSERNEMICVEPQLRLLVDFFVYKLSNEIPPTNFSLNVSNTIKLCLTK